MTEPLPVGVVGVGVLGWHHARHLASMPGVKLEGVYDIRRDRAEQVARALGTRACRSRQELLDRCRAVTIAVPTPVHAEVGLAALAAGRPVLMEKPLAATRREADDLLAAAEAGGVVLQVGHVERFNRALRAAAAYLDQPLFIECERLAPFQIRGSDVPVVLDLMIHDLDLILHLADGSEATDVRANGAAVMSPHLDVAHARVEFASGLIASVTASRIAEHRVRRLRIYQEYGCLELDLAAGRGEFIRLRRPAAAGAPGDLRNVTERVALEAPPSDALRLELAAFLQAVRGEREDIVTGLEGRLALDLALRVAEAVRQPPMPALPGV
ncbi:MAG TPA: Gfo/Idh/MocA family oxidoreductase [Gemmatimonadales bacterium]|nr:Gfo/Idh/MocA family oxidoreductase [Gemmatimonadales bacterium]